MKWTKTFLQATKGENFSFQESVVLDASNFPNFFNLKELKDVTVSGDGKYDASKGCLLLNLRISGIMVIPCARTLELIDYPFKTDDSLTFSFDEPIDDETIIVRVSEIDITEALYQCIMYAIPLKVVKEGTSPIEVCEDEGEIDPRFAKLKDLFKD